MRDDNKYWSRDEIELIHHIREYEELRFVFKIRIRDGYAYMGVGGNFYDVNVGAFNKEIVVVDSKKFLTFWQKGKSEISLGDESNWRSDRKFRFAEEGFSYGIKNPVPLAYFGLYEDEIQECHESLVSFWEVIFLRKRSDAITCTKQLCGGFNNGITRTIWLLANKAKCFPLLVDKSMADVFHNEVGYNENLRYYVRDFYEIHQRHWKRLWEKYSDLSKKN